MGIVGIDNHETYWAVTDSYMNLMKYVPATRGNRVPPDTWQPLMTAHSGNITETRHAPLTLNLAIGENPN